MAALSITATGVIKSTNGGGIVGKLAAGVTATAGQAMYQLADGTYGLADANAGSPGDIARTFAGMSLLGGSPGQWISICPYDSSFTNGASGITVGAAIYVGDTAGSITQTLSDATGGTAIQVGIALTATTQSVISGGLIGGTVA